MERVSDGWQEDLLRKVDIKLNALIAVFTEGLLRMSPELGEPRPRSIEKLLHGAGLSGVEIAGLLGKTPQAVSARLQTARQPKATAANPPRGTTPREQE